MFKHFVTTLFHRHNGTDACRQDKGKMTQSELQDLFRNEFEVHNRSALEITARHASRRPQAFAA